MSRINHNKINKEKTEDYTFKSVSSNKRIYKKSKPTLGGVGGVVQFPFLPQTFHTFILN